MSDATPAPDAAPALPTHGEVGRGPSRVHYVAAVIDGVERDHPGDLIPFLAAEDIPGPRTPSDQPRRTSAGF